MSDTSKKFKVGDKVVRTEQCEDDYTIKQWGVYIISKIDKDLQLIFLEGIYDKDGKPDWFNPRNFELVKEEVAMSEQTHKTPYQEKGYTENSLFKFVGDGVEFEIGEVVKLHSDDGSDIPDFKSVTRDRSRYCSLDEDVEYIGEDGCEDMLPHYVEQMKQPTETEQGVKYDSGKLEYSLIPKGVLTPIIRVLQQGCQKYSKDNWQHVDNPKERYYNALQRHINQWWEGEKYDAETGENHLAHAACCLMFLLWFDNKDEQELQDSKDMWQALTKVKE